MSVIIRKAVLRDTSVLAELSVQARVFHNGLSCGYFADPDPRAEELFFKQAVAAEDKIILAAEKKRPGCRFPAGVFKTFALFAPFVRLSG